MANKGPTEIKLEEYREEDDVEIDMPEESITFPPYLRFLQRIGAPTNILNSLNNNKKFIAIGLIVLAIIIIISIIAIMVYFYIGAFGSTVDFNYASSATYSNRVGPITISPANNWIGTFNDIPKPNVDLYIQEVTFTVEDEDGQIVEVETVFVNSIALQVDGSKVAQIMQESAEDTVAMKLPADYGVYASSSSNWQISSDLINMWGLPSFADITVYIKYSVTYTNSSSLIDSTQITNVKLEVLGESSQYLSSISPSMSDNTNDGSVSKVSYSFSPNTAENGDIIASIGFLSPGGIDISLSQMNEYNVTQLIATFTPLYRSTGYIQEIPFDYHTSNYSSSSVFLIEASYPSNSTYLSALSLVQIYRTSYTAPSSPSPTTSATPAHSVKVKTMSPSVTVTVSASPSASPSVSPSFEPPVNGTSSK